MSNSADDNQVPAASRAFAVLHHIAQRGPCSLAEIVEEAGERVLVGALQASPERTVTDLDEFRVELVRGPECGWVINHDRFELGVSTPAAPTFRPTGRGVRSNRSSSRLSSAMRHRDTVVALRTQLRRPCDRIGEILRARDTLIGPFATGEAA